MEEEEFVFIIKYGGHWGARGWTCYQKRFKGAKEAYNFYRLARLPKEVGLEYNNGFQCSLSDAGMRQYFGAFMQEDEYRNCLNCKFLHLCIIDGKLVPACGFLEPPKRLRKFGYCGFWERKIIKLLLTNRLKRRNK